jgi:hypothetical protein
VVEEPPWQLPGALGPPAPARDLRLELLSRRPTLRELFADCQQLIACSHPIGREKVDVRRVVSRVGRERLVVRAQLIADAELVAQAPANPVLEDRECRRDCNGTFDDEGQRELAVGSAL